MPKQNKAEPEKRKRERKSFKQKHGLKKANQPGRVKNKDLKKIGVSIKTLEARGMDIIGKNNSALFGFINTHKEMKVGKQET